MADAGGRAGSGRPGGGGPGARGIARATSRAREYLADPQRLGRLVEDAVQKSQNPRAGRFGGSLEELKALLRLALAYSRGDYRGISREKLLMAVGAILYFLSPLDLVPDFLGVLGLTDDAVVLAFFLRTLREEIGHFLAWEADQLSLPSVDVIEIRATERGQAGT